MVAFVASGVIIIQFGATSSNPNCEKLLQLSPSPCSRNTTGMVPSGELVGMYSMYFLEVPSKFIVRATCCALITNVHNTNAVIVKICFMI